MDVKPSKKFPGPPPRQIPMNPNFYLILSGNAGSLGIAVMGHQILGYSGFFHGKPHRSEMLVI
jgi:hypothetical protein